MSNKTQNDTPEQEEAMASDPTQVEVEAIEVPDTEKPSQEAELAVEQEEPAVEQGSKVTPVRIAIAIAAVAAIYSVHGAVKEALAEPRVAFETHEGITDIEADLQKAGLGDTVIRLTEGDGKIDILYAGAPECIHCQDFISGEFKNYPEGSSFEPTSFEDLVAEAERLNLDFAYMPLAFDSIGIVLAAADTCAAPGSTLSPIKRIQAAYAQAEPLREARSKAEVAFKDENDPVGARAMISTALSSMHEAMAPGTRFDAECHTEAGQDLGPKMSTFLDTFGKHGTPSFFFRGDDGGVYRFSGSGGIAPMLRQLGE